MKQIGTVVLRGQVRKLHRAFYDNNRTAIVIDEGMSGKVTVNIPDQPLAPGYLHVKMWFENEWMREPLLATGLFEDTGERVPTGMAHAELWKYLGA